MNYKDLPKPPINFSGFCPIEPVPKGRPRMTRTGRVYNPIETSRYEKAVRIWMEKKYGLRKPMDGIIKAEFDFLLPRPQSKKEQKLVNTKPDLDNLVKSFQDALDFKKKIDGIELGVISNDSRIAVLKTMKRYTNDYEQPGTRFHFQIVDDGFYWYDIPKEEMHSAYKMKDQEDVDDFFADHKVEFNYAADDRIWYEWY